MTAAGDVGGFEPQTTTRRFSKGYEMSIWEMSSWELRQYLESMVPAWTPLAILAALVILKLATTPRK